MTMNLYGVYVHICLLLLVVTPLRIKGVQSTCVCEFCESPNNCQYCHHDDKTGGCDNCTDDQVRLRYNNYMSDRSNRTEDDVLTCVESVISNWTCCRFGEVLDKESHSVLAAVCVLLLITLTIGAAILWYCLRQYCKVGPCCKCASTPCKNCTKLCHKEPILSDIEVSFVVEEPPYEKIRPIEVVHRHLSSSKQDFEINTDDSTGSDLRKHRVYSCTKAPPFPTGSDESTNIHQVIVEVEQESAEPPEIPMYDLKTYLTEARMLFENRGADHAPNEGVCVFSNPVFSAGLFDIEGGYLNLENMDISLYIPPGALPEDELTLVYLSCEAKDREPVAGSNVSVSSVIRCGPSGLKFQERVVLSFQHCADTEDEDVRVTVVSCDADDENPPVYKNLKDDKSSMSIVRDNKCIVYVSHFTGFTAVAEAVVSPQHDQESQTEKVAAKKWVEIIGFHGALTPSVHKLPLRLYCVNKTADAKQLVLEEEYRMSGCQADAPKTMSFLDNGHELGFRMTEINQMWKIDGTGPLQSIDNEAVMLSSFSACSYRMTRLDTEANTFDCVVNSYQCENPKYNQDRSLRVNFTINEEKEVNITSDDIKARYALKKKIVTTPLLKYRDRVALSHKLDPTSPVGNDWRMLADNIGLGIDIIEQIEDQFRRFIIASSTREVLKYWDVMNKESSKAQDDLQNLRNLENILTTMERLDANEIVREVIANTGSG